jgi:hypothetical protein
VLTYWIAAGASLAAAVLAVAVTVVVRRTGSRLAEVTELDGDPKVGLVA